MFGLNKHGGNESQSWRAMHLLAATPILVGGAFLAMSALRGFLARPQKGALPDAWQSLADMQRSIINRSRRQVRQMLGNPRTAALHRAVLAGGSPSPSDSREFQADMWYYALEESDGSAMAIRFDGDRAVNVDFFRIEL